MAEKINAEYIKRKFEELSKDIDSIKSNQNAIANQLFDMLSTERDLIKSVSSVVSDNQGLRIISDSINQRAGQTLEKLDDQTQYNQILMSKIWTLIAEMKDVSNQVSSVVDRIGNFISTLSESYNSLSDKMDIYRRETSNDIRSINDSVTVITDQLSNERKLKKSELFGSALTGIAAVIITVIALYSGAYSLIIRVLKAIIGEP